MQGRADKPTMTTPAAGSDAKTEPVMGGGSSQRSGMLAVNDLNYILPPDLSVTVNNTFKNHYFQSSTYTNNQRAICILNSGADYGDMRTSTLNFTIAATTFTNECYAYFGKNGSALNCIRSITISSRSGDEIARSSYLNHRSAAELGFKYSANWVNTVGQAMGYGAGVPPTTGTPGYLRVSIPLYVLSDFFAYGRLMPAMVLAGLRVEIDWENPTTAFQQCHPSDGSTPTVTDAKMTVYTISDLYISLRSVQLTDGTQRALNEMSAVNGLEIVYCDYEQTEQTSDATVDLEVRKAASRALKATVVSRPTDAETSILDSFSTETFDYKTWQWQLGSLYFPQQPVQATTPDRIIPESYQHTLVAFHTYKGDSTRCSAIPLRSKFNYLQQNAVNQTAGANTQYWLQQGIDHADAKTPWTEPANTRLDSAQNTAGHAGTFANGRTTLAVLLERSDLFNLTGVPINNSRVLKFRATYNTARNRIVTIFLKYVRLARVFLNNVEVEQ
jgi:hypothetical protein